MPPRRPVLRPTCPPRRRIVRARGNPKFPKENSPLPMASSPWEAPEILHPLVDRLPRRPQNATPPALPETQNATPRRVRERRTRRLGASGNAERDASAPPETQNATPRRIRKRRTRRLGASRERRTPTPRRSREHRTRRLGASGDAERDASAHPETQNATPRRAGCGYFAHTRLLRGLCSSSTSPRCSRSGGRYIPNRPR